MKTFKYYYWIPALFFFFAFVIGCDDIFETDISSETVLLTSPADGVAITGNEVKFLWEPVDGAYGYLLQVFAPSLEQVETVVLDTFVVGNSFAFPFDPGTYEWRVSAENSAYFTPFTLSSFQVLGSGELGELTLMQEVPADKERTNVPVVNFRWNALEPAEFYYLELFLDGEDAAPYIIKEEETQRAMDFQTLLGVEQIEQTILWQVRAFDAIGQSVVSEIRKLYLDNIPLEVPPLVKPADEFKSPSGALTRFEWDMVDKQEQLGSFNFYLYRQLSNGGIEPVENYSPRLIGKDTFLEIDGLPAGAYFWGVQTVDTYGNESLLDANGRIPENFRFSFSVQ